MGSGDRAEFDATRAARLFGAAIYNLRSAKGWSQRQLAEAAGMKQQSISWIEEGARSRKQSWVLDAVAAKLALPPA